MKTTLRTLLNEENNKTSGNILIYTTRALTGSEGSSVMPHFKLLKENNLKIDFLTFNKNTNKVKELIENFIDIKIHNSLNLYSSFYENEAINLESWEEVYDKIDVSPLQNYKALYVFGGICNWKSGLSRHGKRVGVFPCDKGQLKYKSVGIQLTNILAILKAHRVYNIPLHELSFDHEEISYDLFHEKYKPNFDMYTIYHGYEIPKYNIKRLDSLPYFFNTINRKEYKPKDKQYDFTFGLMIFDHSDRCKYFPILDKYKNIFKNTNIFIRCDMMNINVVCDKITYWDYIAKSKYTMIIPSYDIYCFSIWRFQEALIRDCLPLIHKDCNVLDVEKSYNIDLSELIIDFDSLDEFDFSDEYRLNLLDKLKSVFLKVDNNFV